MVKRKRAALLPSNLALLQNLIKRDKDSYVEDFLQQYKHFESQREIFLLNPSDEYSEDFNDLVNFLAHVSNLYPKYASEFPEGLIQLVNENHTRLNAETNDGLIRSLVLLKNKGDISPEKLVNVLFQVLISTSSKAIRHICYSNLVLTITNANALNKNPKLNRSVQTLLFNLLQSPKDGLWAVKITRQLWRKNIWDDAKSVEIMRQACLHRDTRTSVSGAKFFIGIDKEKEEFLMDDSSDEETQKELEQLRHRMKYNKKTSKRDKTIQKVAKELKNEEAKDKAVQLNFSALHLLNDPQGFVEQLYSKQLGQGSPRHTLEHKIVFLNLISRLSGMHKVVLLNLYSYILRYLTPKQLEVTKFLACAVQSSHELVPPETLQTVVEKIANEFVSDGVSSEAAAAGLNTIREILARNPLAITPELLQDLTAYKGSKSKSVVASARGLIGLYREVAPEMLNKKDRGKEATEKMIAGKTSSLPRYGEEIVYDRIEGLELLEDREDDDDGDDDKWEVASDLSEDSDDSEEGWINMESDKEYEVSDSEDEKEKEKEKGESAPKAAVSIADSVMAKRILTPADFAKLDELRKQKIINEKLGLNLKGDESIDPDSLLGAREDKLTKEEKIERMKEGREGRDFGSKKGNIDHHHSTTNREKARKKNIIMMAHNKAVKGKAKRSLRLQQKLLKHHMNRQRGLKR
ncbi:hypothetical protein CANCADRAFT_2339 [Tortispora caseinolytica NRRL Y-17796]|uniref:Protein SDA1 n=1 Tax=Tortispora caseinolytica NRRL Y-17796 TaxID=767744 RepID=A0A1E4TG05_9ASCO|nr:hypothetical protein CANCADRAFT_2339 [Tortispora caseinolytica NRRL Y-17796]